ncbi:MAG: nucleotidyltransferase family protein [Candidatus Obscuribacterales bacterium]|nr:nucleotidyltransferase family protein [Candidatus Obscuribacterales bacterium]
MDWLHQQTPEVQILLYACRVTNRAVHSEHLRALTKAQVNYETLFSLAKKHRMLESLSWLLGAPWLTLPAEVSMRLRGSSSSSARLNADLFRELIAITNAAASQAISLLHVKGPTLALLAYHDTGLRHCGDLDVLVRKEQLREFQDLLRKRGYCPTVIESAKKATWEDLACKEVLEVGSEMTLVHPGSGIAVDLHWRLMKESTFSIGDDSVWDSMVQLKHGGIEFNVPSAPTNFLYLAMHAAKHGWTKLRWIADLASLTANDDFDYDRLIEFARKAGYYRFVLFVLQVVSCCPGVEIPERICELLAKETKLQAKASALMDKVLNGSGLGDTPARLLLVSLQDNPLAAARMIGAELFEPTLRDWEYLRLPVPLLPLSRQLRLVSRYLLKRR